MASTATAFPHRYDHFDLLVHPATDDPADSTKMIAWARECWNALTPFVDWIVGGIAHRRRLPLVRGSVTQPSKAIWSPARGGHDSWLHRYPQGYSIKERCGELRRQYGIEILVNLSKLKGRRISAAIPTGC